jgi:hypothetical protein
MSTGSFPWVKRGRGVALTTHPSSAEVKERVELHLYSPLWAFVACSRVNGKTGSFYIFNLATCFGITVIHRSVV